MLKNLIDDTKKSMDEMQKKMDYYKEKSESLDTLQAKLIEVFLIN